MAVFIINITNIVNSVITGTIVATDQCWKLSKTKLRSNSIFFSHVLTVNSRPVGKNVKIFLFTI